MNCKDIIENIHKIYSQLPIPLNLQQHMFRVAAVGELICNNWTGPNIDKTDVITYLLLHDIGNIVKYDFSKTELYSDDVKLNLSLWKQRQEETIQQYGNNDGEVTIALAKQLNAPQKIIELLQHTDFLEMHKLITTNDWENKIGKYSDLRVGPFGVLTLKERFEEAKQRYADKLVHTPKVKSCITAAFELEKQIMANTTLLAEQITNDAIKPYFELMEGISKS